jgi:hypothetical protein
MKILVNYSRRKWAVLLLVHLTYVCTEMFWAAVLAPLALDMLVVFPRAQIFQRWLHGPVLPDVDIRASVAVDVAVRTGLVLLGAVLNALFSYVFDLTFYRGAVVLLFGIVFFTYAWYALMPVADPGPVLIVDTAEPRFPVYVDGLDPDTMIYADYVFLFVLLAFVAGSTEVYVFAEPWTFATVYVYYISVVVLTAVGDVKVPLHMHWWALLIFVVFWASVLLVIYQIDLSRKHDLARFFT